MLHSPLFWAFTCKQACHRESGSQWRHPRMPRARVAALLGHHHLNRSPLAAPAYPAAQVVNEDAPRKSARRARSAASSKSKTEAAAVVASTPSKANAAVVADEPTAPESAEPTPSSQNAKTPLNVKSGKQRKKDMDGTVEVTTCPQIPVVMIALVLSGHVRARFFCCKPSISSHGPLRCTHCSDRVPLKESYRRSLNIYSCAPCNQARLALQSDFKRKGRAHVWKGMTKREKDNEIKRNKGKARGRGNRFPVLVSEKVMFPQISQAHCKQTNRRVAQINYMRSTS